MKQKEKILAGWNEGETIEENAQRLGTNLATTTHYACEFQLKRITRKDKEWRRIAGKWHPQLSLVENAVRCGITISMAVYCSRKLKLPYVRYKNAKKSTLQRARRARELRDQGASWKEVCEDFKISRQALSQMLARAKRYEREEWTSLESF